MVFQGSRIKNHTQAPDLLTDSYPLDNGVMTDLLDHQRPRTDSQLFNQFISRLPSSQEHVTPTFLPVSLRTPDQQTWREVNGEWLHQRNAANLNSSDLAHRGDAMCFESDRMDVPLLTSNMVTISSV